MPNRKYNFYLAFLFVIFTYFNLFLYIYNKQIHFKMIKKEIRKKIDEYMTYITDFLTRKWGSVDDAWSVSLMQIEDNFFIYLTAREDVLKRGVNVEDRYGNLKPNQSISIMNQSMTKLDALLRNFGLNPLANARINVNTDKGLDNIALDNLMMVGDDDIDENEKHE